MQVEEIFIWEKKTKKNWRISPLDDYYYQSSGSVANQNAGFALVHQLADTKSCQTFCCVVSLIILQTTRKNSQRYYTTKRLIRDLLSNMPNCYVRAGEFWAGPLEYKYHAIFVLVWALFVLYEVQLPEYCTTMH